MEEFVDNGAVDEGFGHFGRCLDLILQDGAAEAFERVGDVGARDEIIGVQDEEACRVVNDACVVLEVADDVDEIVGVNDGGDPVSA